MAIRNLYMRSVTTGRTSIVRPLLPPAGDTELVEQLSAYLRVIQDRIVDISEIVKDHEILVVSQKEQRDRNLLEKTSTYSATQNKREDEGKTSGEKKALLSSRSSVHK